MGCDKYYVITQGSYSDYHIVAVTADKEIAKKIADKFTDDWDECRIETYCDGAVTLKPAWIVYFDKAGNVDDVRECDSAYEYRQINEVHEYEGVYALCHISITVSANDEESAIKIAAEKRAKYLAEKMGL